MTARKGARSIGFGSVRVRLMLWNVGVVALVMIIQLVVLLAAGPIVRVIGPAVAGVIGRVMGLLLAALALGTCYVPARKSLRIDPAAALRQE